MAELVAVLAVAASASDAVPTLPRHLQLSYSRELDIVVTFNTVDATAARVEWWAGSGMPTNATRQTVTAVSTLFNLTGTTDDYTAWIHRAILHGLASGDEYVDCSILLFHEKIHIVIACFSFFTSIICVATCINIM